MMHPNRVPLALLLVAYLACTHCVARAKSTPTAHPLADLNQHARAIYAQARDEILAATDPVLVVFSIDKMVLHHQGKTDTWSYVADEVSGLKTMAHIALAAWTLLDRSVRNPTAWQPRARAFAEDALRSQALLGAYRFTPEQAARQRQIIAATIAAIAPHDKPPTQADVAAFAAEMSPLVMANTSDAAALLLDALNTQTQAIKQQLGAESFAELRVVIAGSHMARDGEIAAQYFARLLGEAAEGGRWVFSEGSFDETTALNALSIHLIDNAASTAFFGDAMRLHRDVLSDAARKYLAGMTLPAL